MAANKAVVRTESEKSSSYKFVKKRAVQLTIKFRIEEFETLMNATEPGEILWSEYVSSELEPRAVWMLGVYPNGLEEENRGDISVILHLTGPMWDSVEIRDGAYHIYLVNESNGTTDTVLRDTPNFLFGKGCDYGSNVSHDQVKKALHADGSLLLVADVEFLLSDECGAKTISESTRGYEDREQWATKFSELRGNEASSDSTIEIGGVAIPVHKSILSAHSPIFNAMFTRPMSEEFQSSVVKITDLKEAEPMRALVRYCYQGLLDDATKDGDDAVEIFKLADKYCIKELKAQLERHFIEKRLSAKNVVAMAVLADMHSAAELKKASIKLIVSEGSAVFEIAEWKELSDGELIAEVFQLARKYRIEELRAQLEKHFIDKRLNMENVIPMAVLADTHSARKLKEACTKLIAQEWKTVSASTDWKDLEETQPKLTIELATGAATLLAEK